jgi:hypothetical protein
MLASPQTKSASKASTKSKTTQRKLPNLTGIPDVTKQRFENLSGLSFDDVRIHYNSSKPAQLQALAYTQGNQVYVASGQERHLPHELGHVVQQKQGTVSPMFQIDGNSINNSPRLEREADSLSEQAARTRDESRSALSGKISMVCQFSGLVKSGLNVAGEDHLESGPQRTTPPNLGEEDYCLAKTGSWNYWLENEFPRQSTKVSVKVKPDEEEAGNFADSPLLRCAHIVAFFQNLLPLIEGYFNEKLPESSERQVQVYDAIIKGRKALEDYLVTFFINIIAIAKSKVGPELAPKQKETAERFRQLVPPIHERCTLLLSQLDSHENLWNEKGASARSTWHALLTDLDNFIIDYKHSAVWPDSLRKEGTELTDEISKKRSGVMHDAAQAQHNLTGVWKIGNSHAEDIRDDPDKKSRNYNLILREDFQKDYTAWKAATP